MLSFRFPILTSIIFLFAGNVNAQFAAAAGQEGTTAIFADSSVFIEWANDVEIERGPMSIAEPSLGLASYGNNNDALGKADNFVLSLGDGGSAIFYFSNPVVNGEGFDFAVFENSFNDNFLELCFVEVSSDGENYFRFESTSLTQLNTQIESFGTIDASEINNLGGKYRALYGTPFDLEELTGNSGLDINNIKYIRLIDVVGCIEPQYASYDSQGNIINDPWPTTYPSSGFDLDAVGIIHQAVSINENKKTSKEPEIYPNPTKGVITIESSIDICSINIISSDGRLLFSQDVISDCNQHTHKTIDLSHLKQGLYILKAKSKSKIYSRQIIIY